MSIWLNAARGGKPHNTLLDGLSAVWLFGEGSGSSRVDSAGAADAVETGGVIGTGAGPGAPLTLGAQFVTSRSLNVANSAAIQHDNLDFTLCGWMYAPNANVGVLDKGNGSTSDYALRYVSGTLYFYRGVTPTTIGSVPATTWLFVRAWYSRAQAKIFLRYNEAHETSAAIAIAQATIEVSTANVLKFGYFGPGGTYFNNGRLAGWYFYKRILTDAEGLILNAGGPNGVFPFGETLSAQPALFHPRPYEVQGGGTIQLSASVQYGTSDVTAQWNGGAPVTVATNQRGAFTTTLTSQPAAQGQLVLTTTTTGRAVRATARTGLVIVTGGQSNASGRGYNNQVASHQTIQSSLYGNDGLFKQLADPTDSDVNKLDTVGSDIAAAGSCWPLVATAYMAARNAPCQVVPCAIGGTTIAQWQPGANHFDRTTRYGLMAYRALLTRADIIVWWQGEQDAFAGNTTAAYQASLESFVAALATDLPGVKVMIAKLQLAGPGGDYSDGQAAQIQAAQANVIAGGHANVVAGPDLSAIRCNSGDHIRDDAELALVAGMWWNAIRTAYGW